MYGSDRFENLCELIIYKKKLIYLKMVEQLLADIINFDIFYAFKIFLITRKISAIDILRHLNFIFIFQPLNSIFWYTRPSSLALKQSICFVTLHARSQCKCSRPSAQTIPFVRCKQHLRG